MQMDCKHQSSRTFNFHHLRKCVEFVTCFVLNVYLYICIYTHIYTNIYEHIDVPFVHKYIYAVYIGCI